MFPVDFWRKILVFYLLGLLQFQKIDAVSDIERDIADLLAFCQKVQSTPGNAYALLGLAPDAPAETVENTRSQFLQRFAPERFGSAAAPEIKRIAGEICRALQTVEPRHEFQPVPQSQPPLPGSAVAASAPGRELPESPLQKVWDLYMKGKEFYELREFEKASGVLKLAIKLDPAQGDFYYLLGLCQNESEPMRNDAEINLKKAVELKPWSADPVYALGMLYRGQDKLKMAELCFQRVKEIAHEHSGASRALVDLRRLRVVKKGKRPFLKKKIF